MFDIYIKDFNQNGQLVTTETLVQSIPSATQGELKLISPTVKAEMGNAEQFNFSIEGGTKFYDAFNQMKTFMRVVYDGDTIFYGRVLTIENGFTGNRKIRLEGPLAFLNDTSIEGQKEEGRPNISVNAYLSKIIDNHNTMCGDSKRSFNLGEVPGNYHSASSEQQIQNAERKFGQDGWTDSKGAIEDLRSHYGGYLRVRCNGHKNSDGTYSDDGHYLDWLNHYFNTSENSQAIEVGKNVIDISTSTEIDNIFTVVIPIGNSKSTSYETADGEKKASGPKHFYVDGVEVTVPSICPVYGNDLNSGYHTYDDYAQALNRYGRIVKTVTFDDAETPAELLTKCHEWIKNNYQGEVTKFTVKAVDMHQIGDTSISKIMVGDRVRIIYPIIKEDGSVEKAQIVRTCLSINYDLYNPENNSYTFGIPANILTKSYGVTKQGKSTKDASTTPKSSGGGSGNTKTVDWLDQVTDWLTHHKAYYKHKSTAYGNEATVIDTDVYPSKFGYKEEYRSYMKGPYGNHRDYIYDIETVAGVGRFTILNCVPVGTASDFSEEVLRDQLKRVEDSMKGAPSTAIEQAKIATEKNYRNSCKYETYKLQPITLNGILTHAIIDECHIIPYVKMEYGIDLTNFNNTKMPPLTYTDSDGVTKTIEGSDGQVITKEMFNKDYQGEDLPDGWHIVLNKEGKEVGSCKNADGEWEYWMRDEEGNIVQTSIRKLEWLEADGVKFRGSLIQGDWTDEDGNPHIYKFGQEIETWADGEMVVAHVDGDVIRVGNRTTKYATTAATRINGNWLSPIEYVVDTTTGQKSAILVGTTGQASYEAYYDKKLKCYVPVPFDYYERWTEAEKAAWLAENGPLTTMSGDGIWDTKTLALKGGIQTVIEDGKPVSYLLSERTVVGNKNTNLTVMQALLDSGVITQDEYNNPASQALVSQTIYVEDMNGVNAHFHTIETDYLKTSYLKSEISKLDLVNVQAIAPADGYSSAYCRLDSYYGNHFYFNVPGGGGSVTYKDLRYAIDYVYVTSQGATSTIHLHSIMQGEITQSNKPSYMSDDVFNQLTFKNYTGGWDAAYNRVDLALEDSTANTYTITTPSEQVDGAAVSRKYFLTDEGKNYVRLYTSVDGESVRVARYFHNRYDQAWKAACGYVSYPTTENTSTNTIEITYPESNKIDGGSTSRKYYLTDDGDNYVKLYTSVSGETKTVARYFHNKYNSGWDAARNSVIGKTYTVGSATYSYFPVDAVVDANRLNYIRVARPNETVDGSLTAIQYYISSGDNEAYIRYGNGGPIVAKVVHNKYNSGWTGCYNTVTTNYSSNQTLSATNQSVTIIAKAKATPNSDAASNVKSITVTASYSGWYTAGWLEATTSASSNHQGTLAYNTYYHIFYKDASGTTHYSPTWLTPAESSPVTIDWLPLDNFFVSTYTSPQYTDSDGKTVNRTCANPTNTRNVVDTNIKSICFNTADGGHYYFAINR